jgi:putative endonuclease
MKYYTYILLTSKNNYYYGYTNSLRSRMNKHKKGQVKSTKRYLPVKLIHYESFGDRSEAMKREKYFKSLKNNNYIRKLIKKDT